MDSHFCVVNYQTGFRAILLHFSFLVKLPTMVRMAAKRTLNSASQLPNAAAVQYADNCETGWPKNAGNLGECGPSVFDEFQTVQAECNIKGVVGEGDCLDRSDDKSP